MGINDEVDAASGARGDWRRDPDGNDGDAGAVRRKPHYFTALPWVIAGVFEDFQASWHKEGRSFTRCRLFAL